MLGVFHDSGFPVVARRAEGEIEIELSGERHVLGPGGLARVDAPTVRALRNTSDTDEAMYLCVGGAGGYVGRDGQPG